MFRSTSDNTPAANNPELLGQTTSHFINRLPDELLAEVFIFRVHGPTKPMPPVMLLLVCRKWFNIAISTPILWTNILYWGVSSGRTVPIRDDPTFRETTRSSIRCRSTAMLARIFERAGTLKFTLGLVGDGSYWWSSFDFAPIQGRCRVVHIWWWNNEYGAVYFPPGIKNLVSLEELYIHPNARLGRRRFSDIMLDVQSNSPRFSKLTMPWTNHLDFPNEAVPKLHQRLKSLTCAATLVAYGGEEVASFGVEYSQLEELDINASSVVRNRFLNAPRLRHLTIRSSVTIPLEAQHVTSLSIHTNAISKNSQPIKRIQLPELKNLSLHWAWQMIQAIEAPNLETLKLRRDLECRWSKKHLQGASAGIHPRVLHMDKVIPEKTLVALLSGNWKDVEEFHLTAVEEGEAFGKTLLTGLSESHLACPNLRRLSIAYPVREGEGKFIQEEREREATMERLRRIMKSRKETGRLQLVSLGWYPKTSVWGREALWNIEWTHLI